MMEADLRGDWLFPAEPEPTRCIWQLVGFVAGGALSPDPEGTAPIKRWLLDGPV